MESSHNLFFLLTLSTLFVFFPASFPLSKCLCQQTTGGVGVGGSHGFTGNINYDSTHHIVSTNQQAATDQSSSNQNQGTTQSNSQGNIQGSAAIGGASQGHIHGSAGIGGASQGNIGGSAGTGGAFQGNIQGSAETNGASQGNIQGSVGPSGASQGNIQGSAGTGGASQGNIDGSTSIGGAKSAGIGGAAQGSAGAGGAAHGNIHGSTGIGGSARGNIHESGDTSGDTDKNLKGFFSKVFAFGDSFSAGFDDQVHGQIMGHSPHGHYCLVDFLCESLGLPPLPSYKNFVSSSSSNFQHGVNFATPGASALPKDELERFTKAGTIAASFLNRTTASFLTQINWFNDFLNHVGCKQKNNCPQELEKSLFWLGGMGIDDHARTAGSSYSLQWLKEKSVAHVSSMLHDLLKSGAKTVVVQGLPPLGCLLFEVSLCPHKHLNTMGCAIAVNAATMIHNRILKKTIETFREQYPNVKIVYGDLWQAFLTVLQNPSKFNFQQTFKACCGTGGNLNFNANALCGANGTTQCSDPSKYIFWDGVHLTAAMNKKLAHLIIQQIGPQLIAGL